MKDPKECPHCQSDDIEEDGQPELWICNCCGRLHRREKDESKDSIQGPDANRTTISDRDKRT